MSARNRTESRKLTNLDAGLRRHDETCAQDKLHPVSQRFVKKAY